jgi:hypothetical protein
MREENKHEIIIEPYWMTFKRYDGYQMVLVDRNEELKKVEFY